MEMIYTILAVIIAVLLFIFGKKKEVRENAANIPNAVNQWDHVVRKYAAKIGVPYPVAMAVMWVESAGNENAKGSAGEHGLYQLKPIAIQDLREMGYGDFQGYEFNPDINIQAGISFLKLQHERMKTWEGAIKAYNQGQAGAQLYPQRAADYYRKVSDKMQFFNEW